MQGHTTSPRSTSTRIQSVDRAIRLLKAIADSRAPLPLPAVARTADVNPSTAWRLLATLEDHGLVARNGSGYAVGYSVVRIAASADETALKTAARPLLERLVDETQEAVSISVPRQLTIVSVDHIAAPRVVSAGWVGEQLPLHCTSNGKLLVASLPEDELAAFLRRPLTALTPATITDPRALRAELRKIRERGYGTEAEEFEVGLHAVSAAARDARDRPIAILSVSGPVYRIPRPRLDELGELVLDAAAELQSMLS
jgi:IclR family transcriptional regulator, KDG regulon repressor